MVDLLQSDSPTPRKVIVDTDPGGDDCFALIWLLSLVQQGIIEVLAITTADGNVSAQQTFSNASQLLNLMDSSAIALGRGAIVDPKPDGDASHIHGQDGMGNLSHQLPSASHHWDSAHASVDILVDHLSTSPGQITIIAIGPLTNLAIAETNHPGILKQAKEIIVMGGAFEAPGNVTPHAEFNIWFNPIAAQTVFSSQANLVVLPLDVTHQLVFTHDMAAFLRDRHPHHPVAEFLYALCQFMTQTARDYRETGQELGFLVHDAATIGYLIYPETMMMQRSPIWVETQGEWTRGQTLRDRRLAPKPNANAWIGLTVDADRFFTCLLADLESLMTAMQ